MRTSLCKYLLVTTLAALLSACITDRDACVPDPSQQGEWQLNLNIRTASLATRSQTNGTDHKTDNTATPAENYIDLDDLNIVILDEDGVVKQIVGSESVQKTGDGISLHVTLERDGVEKIKLMVLANWKNSFQYNTSTTGSAGLAKMMGASLYGSDGIFENDSDFNFVYTPVSSSTAPVSYTSWSPSIADKKGVPMVGLSNLITIPEPSNIFVPELDIDPIWMLRALAKIEIVDMVPEGEIANIERCVLTKYNTSGRFIPKVSETDGVNTGWNELTTQVTSPSIPAEVSQSQNLQFVRTTKNVRPEGATAEVERDCFVVYIPEMVLSDADADDNPVIEVYIKDVAEPYPIYLGDYNAESHKFNGKHYKALLRNHNYRFNINKVEVGAKGELVFVIETPWQQNWNDSGQEEWDFEDVEEVFESPFKWTDGANYEEDPNNPLIPQRTLVITQDVPIEGTFKLSKPVKGTWTLALYGDDFTLNDHFRIDIYKNGEWVNGAVSITGDVGEEITFRIIPTAANDDVNHYKARIVMTCMTFDGQIKEVNLTGGDELPTLGNNGYYFVKQYYSGFGDDGDDQYENNNQN